ncbi:MAG: flagellar FlbD family protein [Treponema sp.]|jgi:flagellar protein FlbD|nr:flagellar FlbD family protein [Treponema sp.]
MIKVSRLDGMEYYLNPHQIEAIEAHPDTTIILLSGKHVVVREKIKEVVELIEAYRSRINPFIEGE